MIWGWRLLADFARDGGIGHLLHAAAVENDVLGLPATALQVALDILAVGGERLRRLQLVGPDVDALANDNLSLPFKHGGNCTFQKADKLTYVKQGYYEANVVSAKGIVYITK